MNERRTWTALSVIVAGALVLGSCEDDDLLAPGVEEFEATLTGGAEVPARTTTASGSATFDVDDGTVSWSLTVSDISNVTAAHIHGPAAPGENAGVLVTLVASGPLTGTRTGSFTLPDAGASVTTLDALLQLMRSGQAYVNVHTNDGVAPENTGPGDFPGGEIRGQIQER